MVILFLEIVVSYHMCQNFEDTLRYFDAMRKMVTICAVVGSGTITEAYDDYYGWYNMYAVSDIDIKQKLSRNEIISMALSLSENRVMRFLQLYKLSPIELILFKETFSSSYKVQDCISYYQENDLDTYIKRKEYKNG